MKSKFSHLPVIEWKERPQKGARREDAFYLNGERITDDEALRHWIEGTAIFRSRAVVHRIHEGIPWGMPKTEEELKQTEP